MFLKSGTDTPACDMRLPVGIFLTGTMSRSNRRRYTILNGKDDNQDTTINDRPPVVGRNASLAPGSLTFNFNISKAFFFGGKPSSTGTTRTNINLFANVTNAFNHPNYRSLQRCDFAEFREIHECRRPTGIEVGMRFQF